MAEKKSGSSKKSRAAGSGSAGKKIELPEIGTNVEDAKVIAAISYLGILCLVPLLLKKDDAYAQHHGKQGLVLLIGWVAIWMISLIPILGWFIGLFAGIALLILSIMGVLKALAGEKWVMPVIGKYADQINL
jgi:uncharacterized membrane protein